MKKKKPLPWEYCECGCKGSDLKIGEFYRWTTITWPMKNGKSDYDHPSYHLNDGHKWGKHLGTWNNYEDLNAFVRNELREYLTKAKQELDTLKGLL